MYLYLTSGRNIEYDRALQIIQSEEYLSEADQDIIKKKRRRISHDFIDVRTNNKLRLKNLIKQRFNKRLKQIKKLELMYSSLKRYHIAQKRNKDYIRSRKRRFLLRNSSLTSYDGIIINNKKKQTLLRRKRQAAVTSLFDIGT